MPTITPTAALTREQMSFFDAQGYLVIDRLFDDADLQPVIDELTDAIDERARELVAEGKLSRTYAEQDFEHRLSRITEETPEVHKTIVAGRLCGPAIFGLISNPKLLDVAERICGPELIASSVYRLRPKMPGHSWGPVPWHQDSGYFEAGCDNALIITVWIPLVDATPERGCMWVLPRAHKGPVLRHVGHKGNIYLEIREEDLPPALTPTCVPVRKGGALIMTNRTPHASFDNSTDVIRWSMDLRYQSASAPTNARITRLEGEPRAGEQGVPPACFPPEADFLIRSQRRPHQIVRTADEFRELRRTHEPSPLTNRWDATIFVS